MVLTRSYSVALEDKSKGDDSRYTSFIKRLSIVRKRKGKSKGKEEVTRLTSLTGRLYIATSLTGSIER